MPQIARVKCCPMKAICSRRRVLTMVSSIIPSMSLNQNKTESRCARVSTCISQIMDLTWKVNGILMTDTSWISISNISLFIIIVMTCWTASTPEMDRHSRKAVWSKVFWRNIHINYLWRNKQNVWTKHLGETRAS